MALTSKREKFCQNVALGMSDTEAYRQAGYKWQNMAETTLSAEAHRVRHHPDVEARISELQAETAEENKFTREWILKELAGVHEAAKGENDRTNSVAALRAMSSIQGHEKQTIRYENLDPKDHKPDFKEAFRPKDSPTSNLKGDPSSSAENKPEFLN